MKAFDIKKTSAKEATDAFYLANKKAELANE
jgi:hypothetical protein